jgi:RNA polymerase sigma-70 factor (ECF subfamily)
MDICQAVLCSFFVRAASGQYELETPDQLLKLLATMARHKLSKAARDQRAARRDNRRIAGGAVEERDITGGEATPSRHLAGRELLEEVHRRLSPEERHLVEARNQGEDWAAIAADVGGNPEALRKRLARAVDRVAEELGIDEVDDE